VLGWGSALLAWQAITPESGSGSRRRHRVLARVVLPLLAFLAFSRYLPALADAMNGEPHDAGYRAGPTFFWTIAMLDLGIFLHATVLTRMALLRGRPWAPKALYLVVGWFGLVGPGVAAMAIAMYVNDEPNATVGNAIAMTILGLAFAMLAVSVYLPLFRSQRRTRPVTLASADTRGG
jgi:hypothetical protein